MMSEWKGEGRKEDLVVKEKDFAKLFTPFRDDLDGRIGSLDKKVEKVCGCGDHEASAVRLHGESPVEKDDSIIGSQKVLGRSGSASSSAKVVEESHHPLLYWDHRSSALWIGGCAFGSGA